MERVLLVGRRQVVGLVAFVDRRRDGGVGRQVVVAVLLAVV